MPSRKATDGEYRDIAHPINSTTRTEIQNIILTKYEETIVQEEAEAEIASYIDWQAIVIASQSAMTPLLLKLPDLLCVNWDSIKNTKSADSDGTAFFFFCSTNPAEWVMPASKNASAFLIAVFLSGYQEIA